MKKHLFTGIVAMMMAVGMAMPTMATGKPAKDFEKSVYAQAAKNIAKAVENDTLPEADDLLTAMKVENTSKMVIGDVDEETADLLNSKFSFSGVSVLSKSEPTTYSLADGMETLSLNLYQFHDKEGLISPDEALNVARSRPMNDSYTDGEYGVYGSVKVEIAYNPNNRLEIKILNVAAMTQDTGTIRTTKMVIGAALSKGMGADGIERHYWTINSPAQNTWYVRYPGFQGYNNLGLMTDQLQGGADFYLSNGRIFSLGIDVRDNENVAPYDHIIRYDDPWYVE